MGLLQNIAFFVVSFIGSLYLLVVMLRFLFQVARVDFYNPISQFIVKATNPVLIPLRKVIPGLFGLDLACLLLGWVFHLIVIYLLVFIATGSLFDPLVASIWSLLGLLGMVINTYFFGILIMVIASWVAPMSHNPMLMLVRQLVEPVIAPFRRIIPPMGGIDISTMFAIMVIYIVQMVVAAMAQEVRLNPEFVLGISGSGFGL